MITQEQSSHANYIAHKVKRMSEEHCIPLDMQPYVSRIEFYENRIDLWLRWGEVNNWKFHVHGQPSPYALATNQAIDHKALALPVPKPWRHAPGNSYNVNMAINSGDKHAERRITSALERERAIFEHVARIVGRDIEVLENGHSLEHIPNWARAGQRMARAICRQIILEDGSVDVEKEKKLIWHDPIVKFQNDNYDSHIAAKGKTEERSLYHPGGDFPKTMIESAIGQTLPSISGLPEDEAMVIDGWHRLTGGFTFTDGFVRIEEPPQDIEQDPFTAWKNACRRHPIDTPYPPF